LGCAIVTNGDFTAYVCIRTEHQTARMSKIKNGGLDQYGAGHVEQQ